MKIMDQAKDHMDKVNAKVEHERQRDVAEIKLKKAEIEKLKAELRRLNNSETESVRLQAEVTRLTAERDLEKHKRERADDEVKRMENMLVDLQRDRADKDTRLRDLENRNREMAHKLPCSRPSCDFSCGREHHCSLNGAGRTRQRGPRNRARASSLS